MIPYFSAVAMFRTASGSTDSLSFISINNIVRTEERQKYTLTYCFPLHVFNISGFSCRFVKNSAWHRH